jgi:probable phosphoglycerate mutase
VRLILCRHGNTFGPGDKISWVGSQNDLPLVQQGIIQAQNVGKALSEARLSAIYFAPLQRTQQFAEIVAGVSKQEAPLIEDARLTELDYGLWSGLTDPEIADKFGETCLRDWTEKSIWPQKCGWPGNELSVGEEVRSFATEVTSTYDEDADVLVVTSNGKLRYFLKLIDGEFERRLKERSFKVATGRVCILHFREQKFQLSLWNELPEVLTDGLRVRMIER